MVTTTSVTSSTAAASSTTTTASSSGDIQNTISDYDKFLLLLTTQMKNQDPTNPMDPTEQMSQLAQFSSVEQAVKTNDKLDSLLTMMTSDKLNDAAGYLGKKVSFALDALEWDGSKTPSFEYQTSLNAQKAVATVTDSTGTVIRQFDVAVSPYSKKTVTWDGKKTNGLAADIGTYQIKVESIMDDKDPTKNIANSLTSTATVSSVEQSNGAFVLKLDSGKSLSLSDIQRLSV